MKGHGNGNYERLYHAVKQANGWEYALFHNKMKNQYELAYRCEPNDSVMFRVIMVIDNLKDAYREYNEHVA